MRRISVRDSAGMVGVHPDEKLDVGATRRVPARAACLQGALFYSR